MNKKAQMSSPFSYIFALIIGRIVFMFLIGFAYKFIALSGALSAAETVTALNDEFAAFSVSESAEKIINYGSSFDFTVFEGKITSEGQSQVIGEIIYAPYEIQGKDLYVATRSLEMPYRVGNLFYLSDGSVIYILVYDSNTEEVVEELTDSYSAIPSNFPREAFSITQVASNIEELSQLTASYDQVRFVFFTSYDNVIDDIQSNFVNYDILKVESSDDEYNFGQVEYSDGEEVVYLGYPMLIGAIVSFNAYSYNYNFDLVMGKLSSVTNVYYDKSKFISARKPECDYNSIKTTLSNYKSLANQEEVSYNSYSTKIEQVESANDGLGGDCPEIF